MRLPRTTAEKNEPGQRERGARRGKRTPKTRGHTAAPKNAARGGRTRSGAGGRGSPAIGSWCAPVRDRSWSEKVQSFLPACSSIGPGAVSFSSAPCAGAGGGRAPRQSRCTSKGRTAQREETRRGRRERGPVAKNRCTGGGNRDAGGVRAMCAGRERRAPAPDGTAGGRKTVDRRGKTPIDGGAGACGPERTVVRSERSAAGAEHGAHGRRGVCTGAAGWGERGRTAREATVGARGRRGGCAGAARCDAWEPTAGRRRGHGAREDDRGRAPYGGDAWRHGGVQRRSSTIDRPCTAGDGEAGAVAGGRS